MKTENIVRDQTEEAAITKKNMDKNGIFVAFDNKTLDSGSAEAARSWNWNRIRRDRDFGLPPWSQGHQWTVNAEFSLGTRPRNGVLRLHSLAGIDESDAKAAPIRASGTRVDRPVATE